MKHDVKSTAAEVIREIGELYIVKIKKETEAIGVKNTYRPLLSALYNEDGGTQLSLAQRTGIKAPTVSITLRKMEKEGIVDRVVDESDLRKTHVYLTEKGNDTDKMGVYEERREEQREAATVKAAATAQQQTSNSFSEQNSDPNGKS